MSVYQKKKDDYSNYLRVAFKRTTPHTFKGTIAVVSVASLIFAMIAIAAQNLFPSLTCLPGMVP
jgi:hypothetical protein